MESEERQGQQGSRSTAEATAVIEALKSHPVQDLDSPRPAAQGEGLGASSNAAEDGQEREIMETPFRPLYSSILENAENGEASISGAAHHLSVEAPQGTDQAVQAEEGYDSFSGHNTQEVAMFLRQSGSPAKRQDSWALKDAVVRRDVVVTYTWGCGDSGQLGLGSSSNFSVPQRLEALDGQDVVQVAGNLYNTAFVTGDGDLLTCGNNDSGQLGVKGQSGSLLPKRVAALDAFSVHHVAVGQSHTAAIVADGMLASWGCNEFGQLGQGVEGVDVITPKLVRRARAQANVRVCAGESHCLMLTSGGQVISFGHNSFGELGHNDLRGRSKPEEIGTLWPLGVVQVSCGAHHSVALTADGRLFAWGRGKYGQLGLGRFNNLQSPQHVVLPITVVQVACGEDTTFALGSQGEIFSWGKNNWGQAGHGHQENFCRPTRIATLANEHIVQVSAGTRHAVVLTQLGDIFAFGNGELGQLGLGDQVSRFSPTLLPRFGEGLPLFLVAAGDHTAAVCHHSSAADKFVTAGPQDRHGMGLMPLELPSLASLANAARAATQDDSHALATLKHAIEDMFGTPGFLILQVAEEGFFPQGLTSSSHGLDMSKLVSMYTSILRVYDADVVGALAAAAGKLADRVHSSNTATTSATASLATEQTWMRALFILLQNPINGESMGKQLMQKIARATASSKCKQLLMAWLGGLASEVFGARNVRPLQKYLSSVVMGQGSAGGREELILGLHLLLLMHNANEKAGRRIQPSEFYNRELSEHLDLQMEYIAWLQLQDRQRRKQDKAAGTELVSVCQTAFCLNPQAKAEILRIDALMQKQRHFQSGSIQALMHGINPEHLSFLDIRVRRERLLEDALAQIIVRPSSDLKKPLRVTFLSGGVPEEGVDQGGVTKEFFQLLSRAIFDEAYGMFTFDQQTRTWWFNHKAIEAEGEFRLVGSLLGLAVYSSVILDVHFPLAIYKKLLAQTLGFEDLKQAFPELGKGLQMLLDFDGDVEAVFCRSFVVEYDYFGEMRTHELKAGGSEMPVTSANRKEFVELYAKWVLQESIQAQFTAFAHGFHEVCGGPALSLFRAEELELLVCGLPHLDFEALQSVARYDGGYNQEHPVIKEFWKTLHSFSLQEKKLFLKFTTGCDRAPVGGLGNLELMIQRSGPDTEALPTSHTCFNYLLLPEYENPAKLRRKLTTAINNAEGFGLQ